MTALTPSARSSGVASAVPSRSQPAAAERLRRIRLGQAGPVLELLDAGRDAPPPGPGRPQPVLVRPPGGGAPRSVARSQNRRLIPTLRLRHVLVDLAVGEPGQRRVLGRHQHFGLGRPCGATGSTTTSASRPAPRAGSPPRPVMPGSPLAHAHPDVAEPGPRHAVADVAGLRAARPCRSSACPSIDQQLASPTASIERHNS